MKTISPNRRFARGHDREEAGTKRFPVTDYAYQAVVLDGFRGRSVRTCEPSFRSISENYFNSEARQNFVSEAAFFVAIIATATWPIVQNLHAMIDFVRAISGV
jgi:hypothetical protein